MLGLDVSDRSVKFAEVSGSKTGQELHLKTVCWAPLPAGAMVRGIVQNITQLSEGIRGAMSRCSPVELASNEVAVSIPERQSFIRVIDLPQMDEQETSEAVRWAIRQHIPFDVDKVYLDWQRIPVANATGQQRLLVGAAQRAVIDPLLMALDQLDLSVMALELEAQAIVRSLLPLADSSINGILLIDMGANVTNVIYVDAGSIQFTTSIQRGGDHLTEVLAKKLGLSIKDASAQKATIGITDAPGQESVTQVLHDELRSMVQEIKQTIPADSVSLANGSLQAILLAGGASNMPGISKIFHEEFGDVSVQIGNALINVVADQEAAHSLSPNDASHFATAIGLALRDYE